MLIPHTWGLCKAIERLIKLVEMAREMRVLKARGLLYIY
jgi:hypothetical protein